MQLDISASVADLNYNASVVKREKKNMLVKLSKIEQNYKVVCSVLINIA